MAIYVNVTLRTRDESKREKSRAWIESKFEKKAIPVKSKYDDKTWAYNIRIDTKDIATFLPFVVGMTKVARNTKVNIEI